MADLQTNDKPTPTPVVILGRTPHRPDALELVELLSYLMDRCFELPGSRVRFGVNSLLLLLPGLGDVAAATVSLLIVGIGLTHYRVPRIVAARMVLNSLLDALISGVPILGNIWDVWFKADSRNVDLLRQYAGAGVPPPTWRHWAVVLGTLAVVVVLLALAAVGAVALVVALARSMQTPAG